MTAIWLSLLNLSAAAEAHIRSRADDDDISVIEAAYACGVARPRDIAAAIATAFELPLIESLQQIEADDIMVSPDMLMRFRVLPVARTLGSVTVAVTNPENPGGAQRVSRAVGRALRLAVAAPVVIDAALAAMRGARVDPRRLEAMLNKPPRFKEPASEADTVPPLTVPPLPTTQNNNEAGTGVPATAPQRATDTEQATTARETFAPTVPMVPIQPEPPIATPVEPPAHAPSERLDEAQGDTPEPALPRARIPVPDAPEPQAGLPERVDLDAAEVNHANSDSPLQLHAASLDNAPNAAPSAPEPLPEPDPVIDRETPLSDWLRLALSAGATSLSIEPGEQETRIRLRVDGAPNPLDPVSTGVGIASLEQLKRAAGWPNGTLSESRRTQIPLRLGEREVIVDLAMSPGAFGDQATVKLPATDAAVLTLDSIGLNDDHRLTLEAALKAPQGLILAAISAGVGAQDLTDALARLLANGPRKTVALAGALSRPIDGVSTVPSGPSADASAIAAARDQDADIILAGVINDAAAADMALDAAVSGALVLADIRATSAVSAAVRFLDFGVDAVQVRAALRLTLARRTVRRLCGECRVEMTQKEIAASRAGVGSGFKPKGCEDCADTGYRGRTGLYEIIEPDEGFLSILRPGAQIGELRRAARKSGAGNLLTDALAKVASGETSIEEMRRVMGG